MALPQLPETCSIYTPAPLAAAMVRTLGDSPLEMWLEPCVGQGVFVTKLAEVGVPPSRIVAVDLDKVPWPSDELAQTHRGTEFLAWSLKTHLRFDKIIGNPPYLNLDEVSPLIKRAALKFRMPDGSPIGGGSNCWVAFLCASISLLREGGGICFVLPASWDYADYAAALRDLLPSQFARFEVHRSRKPLFDSVQDGSIVIVGRGYRRSVERSVRYEYDSVDQMIAALGDERYLETSANEGAPPDVVPAQGMCRLGDVVDIGLGGVTGDSRFFLLTESQRIERNLPTACLRPALSKARHLTTGEMTKSDWESLRDRNERIWLFHPVPRTIHHPAVQAYLRLPSHLGGCRRDRYKIENRSPWYLTPLPKRVDGFISGMTQFGPWICLNSMPGLTATNTLYTVHFRKTLTKDEQAAWALSLLAARAGRPNNNSARVYPQGLAKYEPGDLLDLPLQVPHKVDGALARYRNAVQALLSHDGKTWSDIAQQWLNERY